MLDVVSLNVSYGEVPALRDVCLQVPQGSAISIVGSNGAGKSTLLKSICGYITPRSGDITLDGETIAALPAFKISKLGLSLVPEGRGLFSNMTVGENLSLGAYGNDDTKLTEQRRKQVHELFPLLAERAGQISGTLSGGEQQLLAIGRSLMSGPKLLMLDEPSLGVMPSFVDRIFEVLNEIRRAGTTILLVEQNVERSLQFADYAYVLQNGEVTLEGTGEQLLSNKSVQQAYLGI